MQKSSSHKNTQLKVRMQTPIIKLEQNLATCKSQGILEVFHNTNSPLKSPDKYQSPPPKSAKMVRWNRNLTPTS